MRTGGVQKGLLLCLASCQQRSGGSLVTVFVLGRGREELSNLGRLAWGRRLGDRPLLGGR